MVASLVRRAPLAARSAFGVALLVAGTDQAAYQDLGSLLVGQPGVAERARSFIQASSFASLRMATFSLPNPMGAAIPRLPIPDHFEVINASLGPTPREPPAAPVYVEERGINREAKANRLVPSERNVRSVATRKVQPAVEIDDGTRIAEDDFLAVVDVEPTPATADYAGTLARAIDPTPATGALLHVTGLFFGADETQLPPLAFEHVQPSPVERLRLAALPGSPLGGSSSVAAKGMVTGDGATPKSPAERLAIFGTQRAKAEKCLADAVYFESRGESERGQVAVAQVVINRVFSGYYPQDVCGTVYQNAHRYLACQFTFACEGKKLVVNDADSWARAKRIARDMLDGKLWLNDVGKATHYHANWVKPDWIREMRKIQQIGVHTFYRPRKWDEEES